MPLTLQDIFEKNDSNKLVLPDFQRDFEWKREDQKKLLSSFFASIPVGSLLLLEGKKEDFLAKKICFSKEAVEPKEDCEYLLDGQQRLSSLLSIFYDFFEDKAQWLDTWNRMYNGLRNRWFLKISLDNDLEDIWGLKMLTFKGLKHYEPTDLMDAFKCEKISKLEKKEKPWYHPEYEIKDTQGTQLEGNRFEDSLASEMAIKELVPLYSIYDSVKNSKKNTMHKRVLDKIANKRVDELKAEVEDRKVTLSEVFEDIAPNIEETIKDDKDYDINVLWAKLQVRWVTSINQLFTELFKQVIPVIKLPSDEISRAIAIFENINKGGTPLSTFDLIVAKAAKSGEKESLSKRIADQLEDTISIPDSLVSDLINAPSEWNSKFIVSIKDNTITKRIKERYLNLVSIFSYISNNTDILELKVEHIKKNKVFDLKETDINENTYKAVKALIRACAFLQMRCGIVDITKLPYELMILPIAYVLEKDEYFNDKKAISKIEYWYWSSLFSGAYREKQNEQCIKDIKTLLKWIEGEENRFKSRYKKILDDPGYSDKKVLLKNDEENRIPKAIHDGVLQYILSNQPIDFLAKLDNKFRLCSWEIGARKPISINGETHIISIEDHHICPLGSATKVGESSKKLRADKEHILNSVLNRTYISKIANRIISDDSLAKYVDELTDSVYSDHCLPKDVKSMLESNGDSKEVYENILSRRYDEIKGTIKTELDKLEDISK